MRPPPHEFPDNVGTEGAPRTDADHLSEGLVRLMFFMFGFTLAIALYGLIGIFY